MICEENQMLKQLIEQNWDEIKKNIKKDNGLTDIAYNIWIDPLTFNDYSENVLTILIPNKEVNPEVQLDYIKNHYTNCFQDALFSLFGENIEVQFILANPKPHETVKEDVTPINSENLSSSLNPKYRFENFIIAGNNNVAHSASLHVAESPGTEFNPLFIYGGSGLGKTHLMTAIGHYIIENSKKKVLYVTSEQFTNEVIESIRVGESGSSVSSPMTKLREKYRNVDVLLIDDIQFIIGKKTTQEEFFHTFNTLIDSGKAIVMTSDKHPSLMKDLDDRYRSRFISGLPVDIQPPSYETRVAILRNYADNLGSTISDEIIDYIAKNIRSNVRELEGAFNQVYAKTKLDPASGSIDIETAKEILKDTISPDRSTIVTPQLILESVSSYYGVSTDDIISKKRNADIVLPRQIFMYLCREMTDMTLINIATILDKKDHSTVLHGIKKIEDDIKMDPKLGETIDLIKSNITSP